MSKISHIFQFLDTTGDGTGTTNAAGDYSGGVTNFLIAPPAGDIYAINRMIVQIRDAGTIDAGSYGNNLTLANGILVQYHDNSGLVTDLTSGIPIETNADWGRVCYDVQEVSFGSGDNYIGIRWTFGKSGAPLVLKGDEGDELRVVLNDDFSELTGHYFMVQGYRGAGGQAFKHFFE